MDEGQRNTERFWLVFNILLYALLIYTLIDISNALIDVFLLKVLFQYYPYHLCVTLLFILSVGKLIILHEDRLVGGGTRWFRALVLFSVTRKIL